MALIFTAGGTGAHVAAGVMFGVSTLAMAGRAAVQGRRRSHPPDRRRTPGLPSAPGADPAQGQAGRRGSGRSAVLVASRPARPAVADPHQPAVGTPTRRSRFRHASGSGSATRSWPSTSSSARPSRWRTSTSCPRSPCGGCCAPTARSAPCRSRCRCGRSPCSGWRATRSRPADGHRDGAAGDHLARPDRVAGRRCAPAARGWRRGTGSSGPRTWPIPPVPPTDLPRFAVAEDLSDLGRAARRRAGRPAVGRTAMPGRPRSVRPQPPAGDHRRRRRSATAGSWPSRTACSGVTVLDLTGVTDRSADGPQPAAAGHRRRRAGVTRGPGRAGGADPHRHPGPGRPGGGGRDLLARSPRSGCPTAATPTSR